MKKRSK